MRKKIKVRRALVAAALAVSIGLSAWVLYSGKGIEADIVTVERGLIQRVIKETGTIESDNSVIVTSAFAGEIANVAVSEGDYVNAGDLLLSGDENIVRLELKSLKAQYSGLEASFLETQDMVKKKKELYEQGALSRQEYDFSITLRRESAAQLSSLKYAMESLSESIKNYEVTAPINGTITEVYVKKGGYAPIGASLFEISDLDSLHIRADLIAYEANEVEAGNEVCIYQGKRGESLPLRGIVRSIDKKAKEEVSGLGVVNKRVSVEIQVEAASNLRLGSDAEAEITVYKKNNVLCIPNSAVFEMDKNRYVFALEGNVARIRKIKTGLEGNDLVEITSGLSEGERVIRSLGNDIEDGIKIKQHKDKKN